MPENKILIAVKSCARDCQNGANDAIRNTWGKGLDGLYFFMGKSFPYPRMGEVVLGCRDDYEGLPQKTKAILRWSIDRAYTNTFLCDTDTFVIPERLLSSGFEAYDLMGWIGGNTDNGKYYPWPSGGAGYWLSRNAAYAIIRAPEFEEWAEDRMIGQILGPHIKCGNMKAYHHPGYGPDESDVTDITTHFCAHGLGRTYKPEWMHKMYERNRVKA